MKSQNELDRELELEHKHTPVAIAKRISAGPKANYIQDWVYGGIDGAITTFAIVAGAIGADLSNKVVLILGCANLIADGFSMGAANYSGTKAERDNYNRLREMEERHVDIDPDGEREEIREIYRLKGFHGSRLESIVALITNHRETWIKTMLLEEHGQSIILRSPVKAGIATFFAFVICGVVPLTPFIFGLTNAPVLATSLTALVFFGIGSIKSIWSTVHWSVSGAETTIIGLFAAGIAWGIGHFLQSII